MAKKQDDKLPEDGEVKPKKKGLFSFLRRTFKSKSDQIDVVGDKDAPIIEGLDQTKSTSGEKSTTKDKATARTDKAPAKKRGRPKKQPIGVDVVNVEPIEDDAPKKKKRNLFGFLKGKKKPVKSKASDPAKTPAKKRGRPKKNAEDIEIAASETAEDVTGEPTQKKGLFGFLKRKKKDDSIEEHVEETVVAKKEAVDISIPRDGGEGLQMEPNPAIEDEAQKKKSGFFTKKVVMIIVALCAVSGATGAAAIVFAGPLLGNDPSQGLACKVAHKADFVLMKEKRVTAFIRSDLLPPRQRIEMLMSYTKFLETEYSSANLITVSMIDTHGPMSRVNFRGDNVGAQIVYAPDPLLSMATDTKWEVRYVNVSEINGGRFMGDRFILSENEISEFNNDQLLAADCYMEKTEEEIAAEEIALEKATAEADAVAEAAEDVPSEGDGADGDDHAESDDPSFIENMLGMVGLGGGDHSEEEQGEMNGDASDLTEGENLQQAYPGNKGPNADVMHVETGFFDDVLSIVGLGGNDDEMHKDTLPGVLGTRVKYN